MVFQTVALNNMSTKQVELALWYRGDDFVVSLFHWHETVQSIHADQILTTFQGWTTWLEQDRQLARPQCHPIRL